MTTVATGTDTQLSMNVLDLMHEFRHDVFVKRLRWSLPAVDGRERDQYDTPLAKYVVVRDEDGQVTGCARLLPTTSPYMLADLFPQLLGSCPVPRKPGVWELSRFATIVRESREGRILSLSEPTLGLLNLVLDFAAQNDVEHLILVTSVGIERLMIRAGIIARRAAPPATVAGNLCVALFITVSRPPNRAGASY